ncbi:MAG: PAS domain-containing protein [Methanobacterium sp.]
MNRKTDLNNNDSRIESEEYGPILELDYRFFEYMQEGVIVSAVVRDDSGKIIDLILKYANLAAYKQCKDLESGLIEKSIKEINTQEEAESDIEKANEAIITERGIKYETYRARLDKYFSITAFSPKEDLYITFTTDITHRKKAEDRIKKERQKLLDIIEFLPDATFVIDEEREVIAWNKAIEEMTGIKKEDIVGKDDYAYSIPFYGYKRPIIIDLIFLKEEEIESKYSYIKREGKTLYAEVFVKNLFGGRGAYVFVKASALYDQEGNLVGAIETVRDITEQKKAEMDLLESENKFRSTIEQSTDGIAIMGENGDIIEWNEGMEKITGRKKEEEIGKPIWESQFELLPEEEKTPELYDYIKGTISEFLQTGKADWINKPLDRRISRPDGEIRFIQSVTYPIKTKEGIIIGSIYRDITEQKKIEESLHESEEKFSKAFYSNSAGMAITNIKGKIIEVNDAYANITGYRREELLGKSVVDLNIISSKERNSVLKLLTEGNSIYNQERVIQNKNGEKRTVRYTVEFIEYGGEKRIFSFIYDITDLKKG